MKLPFWNTVFLLHRRKQLSENERLAFTHIERDQWHKIDYTIEVQCCHGVETTQLILGCKSHDWFLYVCNFSL